MRKGCFVAAFAALLAVGSIPSSAAELSVSGKRASVRAASCENVRTCNSLGCRWRNVCYRGCADTYSCYPLYGAYGPYGGMGYWGGYTQLGWR